LFSLAIGLRADTIVISQGDTPGSFSQLLSGPSTGTRAYAEAGWQTGATAYEGVTIAATLLGADAGGDLFDAYLSNAIGPGATTLDFVSGITAPGGGYSAITLFTGLSLLADTDYYLTIAPEGADGVYWGIDNNQPPTVLDAGVTFLSPPGWCSDDAAGCSDPAPTSEFFDLGAIPMFSVTNVTPSSVPEPASGLLLAAGLGAGAMMKRRAARR
jgi:hypothetical protein